MSKFLILFPLPSFPRPFLLSLPPSLPPILFLTEGASTSCPRDVDILLIGGPLLSHRPAAAANLFRDICANPSAIVMTTCTGALWLAASGAIDGRTATVNRGTILIGKQMHPKVTWKDQRWYVDPAGEGRCELWTAGGAFAGELAYNPGVRV